MSSIIEVKPVIIPTAAVEKINATYQSIRQNLDRLKEKFPVQVNCSYVARDFLNRYSGRVKYYGELVTQDEFLRIKDTYGFSINDEEKEAFKISQNGLNLEDKLTSYEILNNSQYLFQSVEIFRDQVGNFLKTT
jgi:hypothetical protein